MLNSNHINDINKKGYTIIKDFFDEENLKYWNKYYNSLEKKVLKEEEALIASISHIDIGFTSTGERHIQRIQHVIENSIKGKNLIEDSVDLVQQIDPKAIFLKDRYINQRGMSKYCSLPHQDASTGELQKIGTSVYTLYIALTDADENTGSLFIEDTPEKRTKSLGMCDRGCAGGYACECTPVANDLKAKYPREVQVQGRGLLPHSDVVAQKLPISPQDMKNYRAPNVVESQHKMKAISTTAGDCILLDGWLIHGTAQNMSNYNRRTMTLTYIVPSTSVAGSAAVGQYIIFNKSKSYFALS